MPNVLLKLTAREVECAMLAADGLTNQQIANHLCISVHTTKSHMKNILMKLEVPRRAAIANVLYRGYTKDIYDRSR